MEGPRFLSACPFKAFVQLRDLGRDFGRRLAGGVDVPGGQGGIEGQPRLKGLAVFADVVEHPGQAGLLAAAKGAGKTAPPGRRCLPDARAPSGRGFVLGLVGEKAG